MNFATQALGIIFTALILIIAIPLFINLLVAIGPLWVLLIVVGALLFYSVK
jgi:hypothetical protein